MVMQFSDFLCLLHTINTNYAHFPSQIATCTTTAMHHINAATQ